MVECAGRIHALLSNRSGELFVNKVVKSCPLSVQPGKPGVNKVIELCFDSVQSGKLRLDHLVEVWYVQVHVVGVVVVVVVGLVVVWVVVLIMIARRASVVACHCAHKRQTMNCVNM